MREPSGEIVGFRGGPRFPGAKDRLLLAVQVLDHQDHLRRTGRHGVRVEAAIARVGRIELVAGDRGVLASARPVAESEPDDRDQVRSLVCGEGHLVTVTDEDRR